MRRVSSLLVGAVPVGKVGTEVWGTGFAATMEAVAARPAKRVVKETILIDWVID